MVSQGYHASSPKTFLMVTLAASFLGELAAPGYAALGCSTCTMVVIFAVAGCLFVALVAPVVPSFWTDVAAHFAIHEEGSCIKGAMDDPDKPCLHLARR